MFCSTCPLCGKGFTDWRYNGKQGKCFHPETGVLEDL